MSDVLKRYEKLTETLATFKTRANKADGALQAHKERLKKEFKCTTIRQAEKLQIEMLKALEEKEEQLEAMLDHFEQEWGELLNEEL